VFSSRVVQQPRRERYTPRHRNVARRNRETRAGLALYGEKNVVVGSQPLQRARVVGAAGGAVAEMAFACSVGDRRGDTHRGSTGDVWQTPTRKGLGMTFTEAAEAVLRKLGRALHYKKITQLAIDQNLLSHIGKTPEVTMSTRLATLTKKDSADQSIVRVRPGVFGLREWGPNAAVDADAGTEAEEETAEAKPAEAPKPAEAAPARAAQKPQAGAPAKGRDNDRRGDRQGEARPAARGDAKPGGGRNESKPGGGRGDGRQGGERQGERRGDGRQGGERQGERRGGDRGPDRRNERAVDASPKPAALPVAAEPVVEETPVTPVAVVETTARVETVPVVAQHEETAVATEVAAVHAVETPANEVVEAVAGEVVAAETVAAVTESSAVIEAAAQVYGESIESAPAVSVPPVEALSPRAAKAASAVEDFIVSERPTPVPAKAAVEAVDETPRDADEIEREERLAASADMFPEEDDDEEPLLGGGADRAADGNRRRRRRRRRGRGDGAPGTEGAAESTSAPEGIDAAAAEARPARTEEPRDNRDSQSIHPSNRDRDNRDSRDRDGRDRDRDARREREEAPRDDETGRDAADLLVSLLTRREDRLPVPMRALVDDAIRAGRLVGDPQFHVPALTAAARMDSVRRSARGERPRLRVTGGRVGLMDWTLPTDLVRAEADALAALERLRDAARRYVVRRLNELPQASFTEAAVMLLERMGISSLKAARRPGLPQGEVHLSGISRRGPEEFPVAVIIKRGGEVGRERVIELRGSLHHYGPAHAGWIVTTGNILSGAREEATQPGTTPITLIDAQALGRLLDDHAVLVNHASVSLPWLDVDLYDLLRGG
jgi:HB1, ASXL, restriction endonuclease HTH domain/Restriction endonuclease